MSLIGANILRNNDTALLSWYCFLSYLAFQGTVFLASVLFCLVSRVGCFILCSWYCFLWYHVWDVLYCVRGIVSLVSRVGCSILYSWYCFLWYPVWYVLYCVRGIVFSGIPCGMFYTVFVVLFSLVSRV
jgi:hypothetical protein